MKEYAKKYDSAHFYGNFECCIIMKFLSLLKVWSISVLLLSLLDHIWFEQTFTLVFMHHPCNSWVFRCVINQINFSDVLINLVKSLRPQIGALYFRDKNMNLDQNNWKMAVAPVINYIYSSDFNAAREFNLVNQKKIS